MKKTVLITILVFVTSISFGQLEIPKFKDTTDRKEFLVDTYLNVVLSKSKVVVAFSINSVWTTYKEYRIVSFENDNRWHSHILVHPDTTYQLFETKTSQTSMQALWENIKSNKLFSIQKTRLNGGKCDAMIFDSHKYEFWIIVKNMARKVRYYNPEFFEKYCGTISDRRAVINCAQTFRKIIKMPD